MSHRGGSAVGAPAARERSRSARANRKQMELGIDFATARQYVGVCRDFNKKGFTSCKDRQTCLWLHAKGEMLYPTAGLELAKRMAKDLSLGAIFSTPDVHIDPVVGLTSYLIQRGSPLVVSKMIERDNCFIFVFKRCRPSLQVAEIARQGFVPVNLGNGFRCLHKSDSIKLPSLYLHSVKCSAWATILEICVSGFQHGPASIP